MRHEESPLEVVRAWQDAANDRDVDRLLGLSDADIETIGPRGSARGHRLLRDWLERAGLSLETLRVFARGDAVVAAQRGVWRSAETGEPMGERNVATRFRVADGRIVQLERYDDLDAALEGASLDYSDEAPPG